MDLRLAPTYPGVNVFARQGLQTTLTARLNAVTTSWSVFGQLQSVVQSLEFYGFSIWFEFDGDRSSSMHHLRDFSMAKAD